MPVSIEIAPFSQSLDMYGEQDPSSSFSLSGHVSISLTSSYPSIFHRRPSTTRILLHSLSITFEGQTEIITPEIAYAPLRLCAATRELLRPQQSASSAPTTPIELSNEGHEDVDKPCVWNVTFDIPVPGWLPASALYGDAPARDVATGAGDTEPCGTRYALYATAEFEYLEDEPSSKWSLLGGATWPGFGGLGGLCAPFRSRRRKVDALRCPIVVNRFIEVVASIPSAVAIHEPSTLPTPSMPSTPSTHEFEMELRTDMALPFTLRLRAKDMDATHRARLRVTAFEVDVEQVETYRTIPSTSSSPSSSAYPLPPPPHQPPTLPLHTAHSAATLANMGLLTTSRPPKKTTERKFSVMPPGESGKYVLGGDGRIFGDGMGGTGSESAAEDTSWYILETQIPLCSPPPHAHHRAYTRDWAGPRALRPSERGPLADAEHFLHVAVVCVYDLGCDSGDADGGEVTERLHFTLPVRFVRVRERTGPYPRQHRARSDCDHDGYAPTPSLPAYSQLFYANGEQKVDEDDVPLPLYEREAPVKCAPSPYLGSSASSS
ncbi:hypothetical protein BJ138DRAFT_1016414 [Hygrophoropsis aurantiaca]|uniref:Uncharacterized protein n=1 Tax=Hygrophoropsis aurantiaca TaxID=72124 RepID=A0ACB8A095_9AGAM|nr:hypothetical protein BJ138DRAFT_1016414 [Hygrophoropsis aurantiaca]